MKSVTHTQKTNKKIILNLLHQLALNPFSCPSFPTRLSKHQFQNIVHHLKLHKMQAFSKHLFSCKTCSPRLSSDQLSQLKKLYTKLSIINLLITTQAKLLSKIFTQNNIKAYLYKDLSRLNVYRSTALFQASYDIDILVRFKDFESTKKILKASGWYLNKNIEEYSRIFGYQWQQAIFTHAKSPNIEVDLQWGVGQTKETSFSSFKSHDMKKMVNSIVVNKQVGLKAPQKHIQLLLIIYHAFYHDNCLGIRLLFEIKHLASQLSHQDWQKSINLAQKHKLEQSFWFTLFIVEKFFSAKIIPDKFVAKHLTSAKLLARLYPIVRTQYKPIIPAFDYKLFLLNAWAKFVQFIISLL